MRAERLHRAQQVEPADGEGEAVGSGLDEAQRACLARGPHVRHEDRLLDAVGVHPLEQLLELGAAEEVVAALEVVLLHPDHVLGLLRLVAEVDVDEAIDRSHVGSSSSVRSARVSTLPVGVIGIWSGSAVVNHRVGTLNELSRSRALARRSSRAASVSTAAPTCPSTSMTCASRTPSMARQGHLHLRGVDGGALHLEHVVEPALEPDVAVVVDGTREEEAAAVPIPLPAPMTTSVRFLSITGLLALFQAIC